MHTVKLTVFIEDPDDIDMEVRVVIPDQAASTPSPVATAPEPQPSDPVADDYYLGGYAGI